MDVFLTGLQDSMIFMRDGALRGHDRDGLVPMGL
jgi:hypothetical protein